MASDICQGLDWHAYQNPADRHDPLMTAMPGTFPPEIRPSAEETELLTAEEVAKMLKIDRSTVYKLIRRNEIDYISIGRRRLITRIDLQKFIERHHQSGGA